jgi:hypothetical protein
VTLERERGWALLSMATATIETIETEYDHCVALRGVDWKGYSTLLRLRGERLPEVQGARGLGV